MTGRAGQERGSAEPAAESTGSACVFAPTPLLTVTVEEGAHDDEEIHLHAGGQGFWIARMLVALGVRTQLCAPLGGEVGGVLRALMAAEGVDVRAVTGTRGNGAYVHDRRGGDRESMADMPPSRLSRHEVDELFSTTLAAALDADVTVLGGPSAPDVVPADMYRRIAADLRAVGGPVVADLSGDTLTAALEGGVTVLKVSHDDLVADGRARDGSVASVTDAIRRLAEEGAEHVVVSRAGDPTIGLVDGELLEVEAPTMQPVDHRGAGDSMTAGLAMAVSQGQSMARALRLAAAAGASNVTRRGLATGQRDVIERLAEHVVVRPLQMSRS